MKESDKVMDEEFILLEAQAQQLLNEKEKSDENGPDLSLDSWSQEKIEPSLAEKDVPIQIDYNKVETKLEKESPDDFNKQSSQQSSSLNKQSQLAKIAPKLEESESVYLDTDSVVFADQDSHEGKRRRKRTELQKKADFDKRFGKRYK